MLIKVSVALPLQDLPYRYISYGVLRREYRVQAIMCKYCTEYCTEYVQSMYRVCSYRVCTEYNFISYDIIRLYRIRSTEYG